MVCTANKCRSPLAEYLLRGALEKRWGPSASNWEIGSAGVRTRGGQPMDDKSMAVLAERGIDASEFVNRRLTRELAGDSDLILAATREHRGLIAQLNPGVLSRLFTFNQFGYLLSMATPVVASDPVMAGTELIRSAVLGRSQLPGRTTEDDTADPIGQPIAQFRDCADKLETAIHSILGPLPR